MDENNNNNTENRLNTVLGVEEDKSVGSKINSFIKKLKGLPEKREVALVPHADFSKTNKDLARNLKKWEAFGKRQAGNPLLNYFFGNKHKVKATKQLFADLERTARKSTQKYNTQLNALLGEDRAKNKGNGFDYKGELGDTKFAHDTSLKIRAEKQEQLNKLTEEYNKLLQKQEKIGLMDKEQSIINDMEKARSKISELEKRRNNIANDAFDTTQPMKIIDTNSKNITGKNTELAKLAAGLYSRTKHETLFKVLEKEINASIKVDEQALKNTSTKLKSANGKKGALIRKLNALTKKQSQSPSNETDRAITNTKLEINKAEATIKKLNKDKKIAQSYLKLDKKQKAQYDYYYANKNKPQDFGKNKDYRDDEFVPKFDAMMRKKTSAIKEMVDSIGSLNSPKALDDINKQIDTAYENVAKLQLELSDVTSKKINNTTSLNNNDTEDNINNKLESTKKSIDNINKSMEEEKKKGKELVTLYGKLAEQARKASRELRLINDDMQIDPFNYNLEASDLKGYNDKVQDIKSGVAGISANWKKSNVLTRLAGRILINIRSQIADLVNPLTLFRKGWDAWLNRFDNLPWKNTFDVISYNLVTAFAPVFEWMAKALIKVAQVANVFIKRWTGVDLFDKSAWQLEQIKKGMGQLTASFDELHSNNDNPNQFNTIFDTDPSKITPLDSKLVETLQGIADIVKGVWDKVIGFIKKHPIASAIMAGLAALFGPSIFGTLGKLLLKGVTGLGKLAWKGIKWLGPKIWKGVKWVAGKVVDPNTWKSVGTFFKTTGSKIAGFMNKGLYTGMRGTTVTMGKFLGGTALVAGGVTTAGIAAYKAGKNWQDYNGWQKAGAIGAVGLGSAAAGLGAFMLGASGPVGWAVAGAVALGALCVGLAQTQDGIGSVKDETEKSQAAFEKLQQSLQEQSKQTNAYNEELNALSKLEQECGTTGKKLDEQVKNGTISVKNMTAKQKELYTAYLSTEQQLKNVHKANKQAYEDAQASAEQDARTLIAQGKKSKSYDELAKHIQTCWENGTMSTEKARELMSRAMANMNEYQQRTFAENMPAALQEGLDPQKYASGFQKFGNWISGQFRDWVDKWKVTLGMNTNDLEKYKGTVDDLISSQEKLTEKLDAQKSAREALSQAEQLAGISGDELVEKLKTGEIAYNGLTDAQKILLSRYKEVQNATAEVNQAMDVSGQHVAGLAYQSYKSSGDYKAFIDTLMRANKNGTISTEGMNKAFGEVMSDMNDSEQRMFKQYMKDIGLSTTDAEKFCRSSETSFQRWHHKLSGWFDDLGQKFKNLFKGKGFKTDLQISAGESSNNQNLNGLNIQSYDIGTNYVPNDQLAYIHQGEAIIPKKYNKPYSPTNNSGLESTISAMTQEIANLRSLVQQGIPVKGEFRQRGSDLVAVVEKGKNKNGNQTLSNPAYAR